MGAGSVVKHVCTIGFCADTAAAVSNTDERIFKRIVYRVNVTQNNTDYGSRPSRGADIRPRRAMPGIIAMIMDSPEST